MFVVLCGSEERVSSGRISRQLQSISPKKSMWCIFKFVGSIQFQNSLYVSQVVAILRRLIYTAAVGK